MKKQVLVAMGFSVFALANAGAQGLTSPACPSGTQSERVAQDACQQAYDIYQFLAPQLGVILAGGNATLGQGSTLGGLGHFSIGLRANAAQGAYPEVDKYTQSTAGAQRGNLQTKDQLLPLPTADAAIGILGGVPLGVTNVFAVDLLVSAAYVPTFTSNTVTLTPSQNLQIGYGAKVGILQESIVVPGVAVTYLKRDLPTTSITATSGSNAFTISNLDVKTTAWRVVASKSLLLFGVVVGGGQDTYDQSANISATVNNIVGIPGVTSGTSTIPGTSQSRTRTNYFADVSLNLPLFKLVGEVGQSSGGDAINTYNSFVGGRADRTLSYFSLGLRLGL
ncbi:MAG: hypothetical protein V4550_12970 [Gemmatimonadota bacterium]